MGIATVHYLSMNARDGRVAIPDEEGTDTIYEDWNGNYTFSRVSTPNVYTVDWGDGSSTERVVMGGSISAIDTNSYEAVSPLMFADPNPYQMAILSDNKTAFVTQPYAGEFHGNPVGRLSVVDLQTNKVLRNIEIPTPWYVWGIALSPDEKKVYVAASEVPGSDGQVFVVDVKSKKVTKRLDVGSYPSGITVHPDGNSFWVTCIDAGQVWVFSTEDESLITNFNTMFDYPARGVFSDSGDVYYYTCMSGQVVAADATEGNFGEFLGNVDTDGGSPFGIVQHGGRLAVSMNEDASVAIIDQAPFEELDRVSVGDWPWDIANDGDTAYVACDGDDSVYILNIGSATLGTSVEVGDGPGGVVLSPDGDTIYVTSYGWSDCDTTDEDFVLSHTYADPGTYTITATDQNGQIDVKGTVQVLID